MCPAPPGRQGLAAVGLLAEDRAACTFRTTTSAMEMQGVQANYIAGTPYVGRERARCMPVRAAIAASSRAWDPVNAKTVWKVKEEFPAWSGAVVTAGDVVFYGTMDGWFKALDAHNGNLLWQFKVGSGIIGQPITYKGPGREAVCRGAFGRRRMERRGGVRRVESARTARPRWGSSTRWRISESTRPRAECSMSSRCLSAASLLRDAHVSGAGGSASLRVCADPNNLPFSNQRAEGFENRLAELVARDLGAKLEYTWWPQRTGFVRKSLNAGLCDVVMGVPVCTRNRRGRPGRTTARPMSSSRAGSGIESSERSAPEDDADRRPDGRRRLRAAGVRAGAATASPATSSGSAAMTTRRDRLSKPCRARRCRRRGRLGAVCRLFRAEGSRR